MKRSPRVKTIAPKGKVKYYAYLRVSTEEQARGGVSLGAQEEKCRAYVELVDGELVDVLVDAGLSGKTLERPALREALERVEAEGDALIVYSIDRLSRSTLDFLSVVSGLRDAGRGFVSVREQMDGSTPHGRFAMSILAALAEMEREMISARCREATARCRRTRRVYGRTPFGFDREGERLVPNPAETALLERIRALREAGGSYSRIAAELNDAGECPKAGARWYASSVRSVLNTAASLGVGESVGGDES